MAIAVVGVNVSSTRETNTLQVDIPVASPGDFLLVWAVARAGVTISPPSAGGWQLLDGVTQGQHHAVAAYWKIANSDPQQQWLGFSSSVSAASGGAAALSGVDSQNPIGEVAIASDPESRRYPSSNSLLPTVAGLLLEIQSQSSPSAFSSADTLLAQTRSGTSSRLGQTATALIATPVVPGESTTSLPVTAEVGGTAGLIVNSPNDPRQGDLEWQSRLEAMGFAVTMQPAFRGAAEQQQLAADSDLVVVASSINSGQVSDNLKASDVGLVLGEAFVADDMALSTGAANGILADILIAPTSNPIVEGFPPGDRLPVSDSDQMPVTMVTEPLAPGAQVLATGFGQNHVLVAIEHGAELLDASPAAARRVTGLLQDDATLINANGRLLVDRLIDWAARAIASPQSQLTFTLNEAQQVTGQDYEITPSPVVLPVLLPAPVPGLSLFRSASVKAHPFLALVAQSNLVAAHDSLPSSRGHHQLQPSFSSSSVYGALPGHHGDYQFLAPAAAMQSVGDADIASHSLQGLDITSVTSLASSMTLASVGHIHSFAVVVPIGDRFVVALRRSQISARVTPLSISVRVVNPLVTGMQILKRPDILAGDIVRIFLDLQVDGQPLSPTAQVRAILSDPLFLPLTLSIPCEWSPEENEWSLTLDPQHTAALLTDASIPTSPLISPYAYLFIRSINPTHTFDLIKCSVGKLPAI